MQLSLSIPLVILAAFSAAMGLLHLMGIHVNLTNPITAGTITGFAGMVGASIPLRSRGDAAATLNAALAGTVVHMVLCIGLTMAAVLFHAVDKHGKFMFWLLGGYWISIFTLIWLARRVVTARALKANN